VVLTAAEARLLEDRAQALGLAPPQIEPYGEPAGGGFVMYAQPCTFLNKANRCLVYRDRPEHCRAFPRQVLEWCLISQKPQSR
jgi:Fe-S-cluster containining protein